MGADELERALGLTTLEKAVRWAQTKSMWPDTFGLACCAIEMMSIVSSRYDIARFGMEAFRSSPRQADLLIVSGRVAHKMAAPLRQIYDQMLEPKWVIAMGACASSGGMFNNYTILQGVDRIVAGRHLRAVLPAASRGADGGDHPAARGASGRRAAGVRDARGAPRELRRVAGLRRDEEAFGETTVDGRGGAHASRRARYAARRARLRDPLRRRRDRLPRLGRQGRRRLHRDRSGRDINFPSTQGLQTLPEPKPKRFSVSYHLLALRQPPERVRLQVLARRRRARAERRLRLADRGLARARAFDLMGITVHGPPEPQPDPDGGRLGRASAAQGLSDRRRAGAVLGRRMTDAATEPTRAWPIVAPPPYEGSRIPSPIPTVLPVPAELRRATTSCGSTSGRTIRRRTACCG